MSRKIYLFRHGETEWNVAGKMQGRLDSPLTERGREQALAHGLQLGPLLCMLALHLFRRFARPGPAVSLK